MGSPAFTRPPLALGTTSFMAGVGGGTILVVPDGAAGAFPEGRGSLSRAGRGIKVFYAPKEVIFNLPNVLENFN